MSETASVPSFSVVSGAQVEQVLTGGEHEIVQLVESTYRLHGAGETVNPPSYFLRFPDDPGSRIIALPAAVDGKAPVAGIKWISSFPANISDGLPRASAVLILNDRTTGYPFACLESSIISATRTAASAVLAAERLCPTAGRPRRIGYFGTGLIARYVHRYFVKTGWEFDEIGVHDLDADYSGAFAEHVRRAGGGPVTIRSSAEELLRSSDLVVFATTAGTPHVSDPDLFSGHPLVLHLSLRDLSPEVILSARNIVDDVEHCLKAQTSVHLAEEVTGGRDFIDGTLVDVLNGTVARHSGDRTTVFSPFGLGVLDLAVGQYVHDALARSGRLQTVPDFFQELRRYGDDVAPARLPG
ncbi:2,3-diaminopropionate biosynthesis protein SbnB [Micromonospora tarensis]|uniref:2,3-diaminopropionate biosynthesis protein SbnB n=1 Tax=Micromonospora tarensis TaxID=2806100 RepID=A0ABS1YAQ1_9ACTN|nr:2,3-diaminopropionate biosynthesis protein SbnB [Micromonospora tarensis]MBM0274409.1 2,3-diaminopropionate biosynthesis protein SbnB [Micromonospora tarensis]